MKSVKVISKPMRVFINQSYNNYVSYWRPLLFPDQNTGRYCSEQIFGADYI
jgi:hypothetical protein